MKYASLILILLASLQLVGCSTTSKSHFAFKANDQYGAISPGPNEDVKVVVIPQWHLAPMTTTVSSSAGLPQTENQRAIYRQLVEWTESGVMRNVIVEGCEGEISDGFPDRFNGWTLADLQALSAEQLDNVMTHAGLKLKAKLGSKVKVVCGDNLDLIKKHQLALSDLRGLLGFKTRIAGFANDPKKRQDYVESVRDLLKMPKDSNERVVLAKLDDELRNRIALFKTILQQRDEVFVKTAISQPPPSAILIGAVHVDDLNQQLASAKLPTQTFTPRGLKGDEAELIQAIENALANPSAPVDPSAPAKPVAAPGPIVN